jgi:hypothetical protein
MALLVVPFNNSMRLGQGFNSYTQTLGVAQAVKFTRTKEEPVDTLSVEKIPQIVTYSSHFVEKLSDVVKALNVSAALSVKVGSVTGSGSGAYIDEDKIKESDINFIIQVKVTNQTTEIHGEPEFNPIDGLTSPQFTDLYGDTFISGFLEGGEFVGVVSVKVHDSNKIQDIKGELEIAFSAVQAKGSGTYNGSDLAKDAETSISVNWSGGGQLKDPNAKWDMETMLRVAAKFPDLCARCPQRTSAILTKYSNLTTFIQSSNNFDTVSYDNVGVYTSDLLDDYMDYKVHWKNIRLMHTDLSKYVKSKAADAYEPNVESLEKARLQAVKNMVLIVHEVDKVRLNPNAASQAILEDQKVYLNPVIFAARLPVPAKPTDKTSTNPVTHPLPLTPEGKIDPQTWRWAVLESKDSSGGDLFNYGNGTASPEDMMKKAYEWELEHPGQFIRAFNTMGYMKGKLLKTSKLIEKGKGIDLYVRVLINDDWVFIPNDDAPGHDLSVPGFTPVSSDDNDIDIVDSIKLATARSDVVSFNSWGWTKKVVALPTSRCDAYNQKPHQGIWIRKSILDL